MTIDEAIKLLSSNGLVPEGSTFGEYQEAVKVGIEALKRVKGQREGVCIDSMTPLPGETE